MNTRRAGIDELLANPPEYENHQTSQLTQAMAIGVVELSNGGTKVERFLQRKLWNFEFWINGKLSKIAHHFSNIFFFKLILSKNFNNKKCAPKLVFFNEK